MSITAEQKAHVVHLIRKKYADWDDFNHQAFRRDEINFKRTTAKKATALLSESVLARLLVMRDIDSFIERLERLGEATPLLQRNESDHGDLEILYVPTLDRPVFCAQIYHLLHGTESVNDRFAAYLQYVEDHELPNSWTFPTYLLQFCYPNNEIFVDPRSTEWFLKYLGVSPSLGKPTPETYITIKQYARSLKQAMSEYRPLDMIDIQSAIHVCGDVSRPVVTASYDDSLSLEERNIFFENLHGYDSLEGGDGKTDPVPEPVNFYTEDDQPGHADFWPNHPQEEEDFEDEADDEDEDEDNESTMLYISEVRDESHTETSDDEQADASPVIDLDRINELRDKSIFELYALFLTSYMTSPAGVARAAAYARARESAEQNFARLIADHELGEFVTDRVFIHLLPHEDTEANQENDVWIHPVFASAERLMATLNRKYPNDSKIREQISQVLLEFIRHCVYKSNALEKSSEALVRLDAISLIDLSSITPILHALKPAQYVLLHEPSIKVINHFGKVSLRSNLQALPELTNKAFEIIESLRENEVGMRFSSVHPTDLFDMFACWLDEKQHFFHDMEERREEPMPVKAEAPVKPAPPPPSTDEWTPEPAPAPPPRDLKPSQTMEQPPQSASVPAPAAPSRLPQAEAYSTERCANETGFSVEVLERWRRALHRKKHLLLGGPAGVGKTFMAQQLARMFVQNSDGLVHLLHFHPGYTYADFMGHETDDRTEGRFRSFCKEAAKRSGPCVLILDEINRVDIPAVFGELLYMLEYRDIGFALSNPHPFDVPSNVYIVGTLHPAGASTFSPDTAIGRRFAFFRMEPDYQVLKNFHERTGFAVDALIRILRQLNEMIPSPDLQIGITYFLRSDLSNHFEDIWRHEVEPQIERAFGDESEKAAAFGWDQLVQQLVL